VIWLNRISSFIARYKGLPVFIAVALVALNFALQFFNLGWVTDYDVFLHLGVIVGLVGLLLGEALG
jgi:hypothetical protein